MIDRAPVLAATLLLAIHVAIVVGSRPSLVPDEREQLLAHLNRLEEYQALRGGKKTHCGFPSASRGPSHTVEQAIAQAGNDVEGCMLEWNERVTGDVAMTVTLSVTDGYAFNAKATGGPDSPFLRLCVAEAIERSFYPQRPDVLDVAVEITWFDRVLVLVPRVVGRRQTQRTNLDL